jgi:hypothetical protein
MWILAGRFRLQNLAVDKAVIPTAGGRTSPESDEKGSAKGDNVKHVEATVEPVIHFEEEKFEWREAIRGELMRCKWIKWS